MREKFVWGTITLGVTFIFAAFYVTVQQSLRRSANDPQISMVQNAAAKLDAGGKPAAILAGKIDVSYDMAPFIIIYDINGNVVAGNGYLDGSIPHIPIGVLNHAKINKVHTVTWQPDSGIRIASATTKSQNYYVVSGRSLATTDSNIDSMGLYAASAWLITTAAIAGSYLLVQRRSR
ncbi:MAG TPA: hypothetical protein VMR45_04080 [Patescibacteria group bacterium]|nr:hypothetical protein [Patescibacteria group bacterium]